MNKSHILDPLQPNRATKVYGGEFSGILNWNDIKYPHFYEIREAMRANFWIAAEVDLSSDVREFESFGGKEMFLELLGTLATYSPVGIDIPNTLANYATDPSVKSIFSTMLDQESEHNHAYGYIFNALANKVLVRGVLESSYDDPFTITENELTIQFVNELNANKSIVGLLELMLNTMLRKSIRHSSVRAYFYHLAHKGQMKATAELIGLINRDLIHHTDFIAELFKAVLAENKGYSHEGAADNIERFVDYEVKWSRARFMAYEQDFVEEVEGYVYYLANRLLRSLGLPARYKGYDDNPLEWVNFYEDTDKEEHQYSETSSLSDFDDL